MSKFSGIPRRWRDIKHKIWISLAEFAIWCAIARAAARLKHKPITVVIDNCALGDAVTHETAWIHTGPQMWGEIEIESGYSARIPVHSAQNGSEKYNEVRFLIGIAELARRGCIELFTTQLLQAERHRQPAGRFIGYGSDDLNLFTEIRIEPIDSEYFSFLGSIEDHQRELNAKEEEPFSSLKQFYEQKQSFDVWHLHTSHRAKAFCFLTTDGAFIRKTRQAARRKTFPALDCEPLFPSELAKRIGLLPLHSFLISHRNQRWAVRHDLHMPGERRRPRSHYKKHSN